MWKWFHFLKTFSFSENFSIFWKLFHFLKMILLSEILLLLNWREMAAGKYHYKPKSMKFENNSLLALLISRFFLTKLAVYDSKFICSLVGTCVWCLDFWWKTLVCNTHDYWSTNHTFFLILGVDENEASLLRGFARFVDISANNETCFLSTIRL